MPQRGSSTAFRVRGPQDLLGGIVVVVLGAVVLLVLSRMSAHSYSEFSPALFPQVCAYGLIGGGVLLIGRGLFVEGPGLERVAMGPVALVSLAVIAFGLVAPTLGYAPAGLLTLLIGGLASPDLRPRELAAVATGLIVFSIVLFSLVLKLSIPILILPGLRF